MKPKHNKFSIMLKHNSVNVHFLTRQLGLEIRCLSKVRTHPAGRIAQGIFGDSQSGKKTGNLWSFLGFWL